MEIDIVEKRLAKAENKEAIGRGVRDKQVRLVQEWLCLHDLFVVIDGDFGPATEAAVKEFQKRTLLPVTGIVDMATFARLTQPLEMARRSIKLNGMNLEQIVVAYAEQHLAQHPREVGGQNRGPWVRLYTGGKEGAGWPWCAAFVSFILTQACRTLGVPMPIKASFSCDLLAASAMHNGRFLRGPGTERRRDVNPGSIFLVRRAMDDWTHTGIVVKANAEVFTTIEGNTNDAGDREGYEVCKRIRGYRRKDFIIIR